jgi:hypothetical protein
MIFEACYNRKPLARRASRKTARSVPSRKFVVYIGGYRRRWQGGPTIEYREYSEEAQRSHGGSGPDGQPQIKVDLQVNLGSINKIFTNIAIHQLAGQRKLSLEDKIGKLLPEYPNKDAAAKVTIRHLLSMTSGIGDFFGERFEQMPKEKLKTISAAFLSRFPLPSPSPSFSQALPVMAFAKKSGSFLWKWSSPSVPF